LPLEKAHIKALRDSEQAYKVSLSAITAAMAENSVCVVTDTDGKQTAFVRAKGKGFELSEVTYLDMLRDPGHG
jgi:hypothetical protein